jgi:hypothetical protein
MFALRKILAGLVLANYLFANTFAAALHDHAECGGHSGPIDQHAVRGNDHCESGHVGHHHCRHSAAGSKHAVPGTVVHASPQCAVCEFLAHAPLAAPASALVPCGDLPPASVPLVVLLISNSAARTHLPRGPPALS